MFGVVALLLSAFGNGSVARSHADPAGAERLVNADEIDSLMVPVEQMPGDLRPAFAGQPGSPEPIHNDECYFMDTAPSDAEFFGSNTVAFRDVSYNAVNSAVHQDIGIYADDASASATFQRISEGVQTCLRSRNSDTAASINETGIAWSGLDNPYAAVDIRTAKNVVFSVTVSQLEDAQHVAASVADKIAAKINNSV